MQRKIYCRIPLYCTAMNGHRAVVELLLKNGAEVHIAEEITNTFDTVWAHLLHRSFDFGTSNENTCEVSSGLLPSMRMHCLKVGHGLNGERPPGYSNNRSYSTTTNFLLIIIMSAGHHHTCKMARIF